MSNNVNKALVIDYSDSRLISCGSLFQGNSKNFPPPHLFCATASLFLHHCLWFFPIAPHGEELFSRPRQKKLGANGLVSDGLVITLPLTLTCRPLCPHLACLEQQKCTHAAPNVLELATRGKPELSHPLQWFPAFLTSQLYTKLEINRKNTFCGGGGPGINAAVIILWGCRWNEKGR